jgi:hypothetical protein
MSGDRYLSSVHRVRVENAALVEDCNRAIPHLSIGYITPYAFATELDKQWYASPRPTSSATQRIASTALMRKADGRPYRHLPEIWGSRQFEIWRRLWMRGRDLISLQKYIDRQSIGGDLLEAMAAKCKWYNSAQDVKPAKIFIRQAISGLYPLFMLQPAKPQFTKHPVRRQAATLLAIMVISAISTTLPLPVSAQIADNTGGRRPKVIETWIEEWDERKSCWIRVNDKSNQCSSEIIRPEPEEIVYPLPRFGPFLMLSQYVAVLDGATNRQSIEEFSLMLKSFRDIRQINFIDASGTIDDVANLKIGRMLRAAGISTHVPSYGSARSGAVELFLAGTTRTMEKGARFAVHQWRDQRGRGPKNFDEHDPVNMLYIDYYMDMGMSHDKAHAFYNMTNSVNHQSALWFGPEEMQYWLDP